MVRKTKSKLMTFILALSGGINSTWPVTVFGQSVPISNHFEKCKETQFQTNNSPKTTKELVTNLQALLDQEHSEIEADSFYTEDLLKKIFGAEKASFTRDTRNGDTSFWLSVLTSNPKFSNIPKESAYLYGASVSRLSNGTKFSLTPVRDQTLSYPDVLSMFACGWTRDTTAMVHRHWAPGKYRQPLNEYGNESLAFSKAQSEKRMVATFLFDAEGFVEKAYFEVNNTLRVD